ncbi:hypothetical protein M406DRAFT_350556 [Cryphonectria parasitica EP155]|uniref:Uncharacterized protein n=1 Tax=Cryphonectria parasitica (strain ATCC 38755 / EP155) TaxID=660469 RepID=A0A9P4Y6K6_CRYP1|nr:uncharacterized protein M406DRAFT_350556 [Cryphonectria parasitica EP155]KAF3767426.1 hypothetical protein M406DRAFT_350556 [Cryphonectria parasitica EP155]
MASSLPPTQQREMPSLPLYPFTTNHHLMAPGPNMEMLSALPVKRGPEDEVQFVSAHSVKKCRGSRESTPAQDQQAAAEQSNSVHQTQGLMSGAEDNRDSPCSPAARGPSPGKPQPAIHRVVSVPMNMGDYVFPPPPRIQASLLRLLDCHLLCTSVDCMYPGAWPVSILNLRQWSQTRTGTPWPRCLLLSLNILGSLLRNRAQSFRQDVLLRLTRTLGQFHHLPAFPNVERMYPANMSTKPNRIVLGRHQSHSVRPIGLLQTRHDMPTSAQQPQAIKPPCLICEQMRQQQALINQANNIPVGNGTPHLQQHGWHGLNAFQQQLHLAHQAAMGTNVGMQNFQLRFQPLLPAQLPMGYAIPQVPGHVPMSMQRGGGGIFPIQGNQNQAQQASTNQVLPQTYTGVTQFLRPEFYQNQIQPPQQAIQTLKPVLASPHAPVPAVLASPALPATAQSSGPSPTSQAPQPAATTAATAAEPRKPSPNLIVDIAETCEEIFPWDEVAKRHGVSRVKVVDTFAAVIQLPLLRCTTDKKRHGKLATSRLREYTKAKKDVEAANSPSATKTTTTPTKSTTTAAATATVPIQACLSRPPQSCEGQLHTKQAPHATQDRPLLPVHWPPQRQPTAGSSPENLVRLRSSICRHAEVRSCLSRTRASVERPSAVAWRILAARTSRSAAYLRRIRVRLWSGSQSAQVQLSQVLWAGRMHFLGQRGPDQWMR